MAIDPQVQQLIDCARDDVSIIPARRTHELAEALSARLLPEDARERIAKWLAYRTPLATVGWDKMFHIEQDHFLTLADNLLAALTTDHRADAGEGEGT